VRFGRSRKAVFTASAARNPGTGWEPPFFRERKTRRGRYAAPGRLAASAAARPSSRARGRPAHRPRLRRRCGPERERRAHPSSPGPLSARRGQPTSNAASRPAQPDEPADRAARATAEGAARPRRAEPHLGVRSGPPRRRRPRFLARVDSEAARRAASPHARICARVSRSSASGPSRPGRPRLATTSPQQRGIRERRASIRPALRRAPGLAAAAHRRRRA